MSPSIPRRSSSTTSSSSPAASQPFPSPPPHPNVKPYPDLRYELPFAMASFHLALASRISDDDDDDDDEEEEEEEEESECGFGDPISSPLILPGSAVRGEGMDGRGHGGRHEHHHHHFSLLAVLVAALRKSLVMCSVGAGDDGPCSSSSPMDIGWPTEVRHVAHVTFDRFDGFLGLPVELEPEIPSRVPSASASVFGVSARSMQCSYDNRGNSVPTILLSMQMHLYSHGGLQVEGIFRINAENSQELYVRDQLNKGIVPHGVDLHCLAGLIKAWFRELPTGVLDSLTPDQVMHCNTEEECSRLVRTLPPTEAALLDWAIDVMADVVENEHRNKMNARNIAMVFAPNMTQMADPLTALIHAVQVMNFLKTLIIKTLREREEAAAEAKVFRSCSESPIGRDGPDLSKTTERSSSEKTMDLCEFERADFGRFLFSTPLESDIESFRSFEKKSEADEDREFVSGRSSPVNGDFDALEDGSKFGCGSGDVEGMLHRSSFRKGVRKLCRHPVFQLSKSSKKPGELGTVNSTGNGREVWA